MLAMITYIAPGDAYADPPIDGVKVGSVIDVKAGEFSRHDFCGNFTIMEGVHSGGAGKAYRFHLIPYEVDASDELIAHLTTHNKAILENSHV